MCLALPPFAWAEPWDEGSGGEERAEPTEEADAGPEERVPAVGSEDEDEDEAAEGLGRDFVMRPAWVRR